MGDFRTVIHEITYLTRYFRLVTSRGEPHAPAFLHRWTRDQAKRLFEANPTSKWIGQI